MLLDWRIEWERTLECPAAMAVSNVGPLSIRLTDNPRFSRFEARYLSNNTGVLTKLNHCKEDVSVMFHMVRMPPNNN